jgi:uncharacterized membrane protein YqaE (UPF0057 family)
MEQTMKALHLVLGILLPPLGVFLTFGVSSTLLINIGLTLLGWIPGSIHAVWAIAKQNEATIAEQHEGVDESVYR